MRKASKLTFGAWVLFALAVIFASDLPWIVFPTFVLFMAGVLWMQYRAIRCPACGINLAAFFTSSMSRKLFGLPLEYNFCPGCGKNFDEEMNMEDV